MLMEFEWDKTKDWLNQKKHNVSFSEAMEAFWDDHRVIAVDTKHSTENETRFMCFGNVKGRIL